MENNSFLTVVALTITVTICGILYGYNKKANVSLTKSEIVAVYMKGHTDGIIAAQQIAHNNVQMNIDVKHPDSSYVVIDYTMIDSAINSDSLNAIKEISAW